MSGLGPSFKSLFSGYFQISVGTTNVFGSIFTIIGQILKFIGSILAKIGGVKTASGLTGGLNDNLFRHHFSNLG